MSTTNRPALGMLSWVGFGEESTYGTAVTPTNYVEIERESINKEVSHLEATTILRRGVLDSRVIPGLIAVNGDIELPLQYDGWLKLAKHGFGTVTESQPDVTNAPTAYNHRFTIADSMPVGLTVEVFRDTTHFTTEPNKSFVYSGCKIDKMSFGCGIDEILKGSFSVMGQGESRATRSTATPSTDTTNYAVFHQGTLKYNGNDMEVNRFNLEIMNGYAPRYKLGSRVTREPVPEVQIVAQGNFECEFAQWSEYDDMTAVTERALVVEFLGNTIAGSIQQQIKFTCNRVFITKTTIILDKPGRIMLNCDFKCYRSQSENEIIMDVRNTTATV